ADPWSPFGLAGSQALPQPHTGTTDALAAVGGADGRPHRPQQGSGSAGEQDGKNLLGSVVPRATLQWRLAECKARLTAGVIRKWFSGGCGEKRDCRNRRVLQRNKADNNADPRDRLNAWPPLCELQNGQGKQPTERPDIRMQPR